MGRFFSGLAQAGAWACFDEFNRIQVEVLSVIAQQMLTITQAIRGRKERFEFLEKEIPLNPRFGVFITMNPGYHGAARPDFFTFFWPRDRSETLGSGPGMLLNRFSDQTVDSGPDSRHF